MKRVVLIGLALAIGFGASTAFAASADDFNVAYAKAAAAEKKAIEMKTSWTTTEKTLKAAKKAADGGKFDDAVKLANEAEALANASIAQAEEQKKIWRDAEIR
jgi:hypothetical protein